MTTDTLRTDRSYVTCPDCKGTGIVAIACDQGHYGHDSECPACKGDGKLIIYQSHEERLSDRIAELERELAAEKEEHAKAASFAVAVDHINAGLLVDVEVLEEKLAAAESKRTEDIRKIIDMTYNRGLSSFGDEIRKAFK